MTLERTLSHACLMALMIACQTMAAHAASSPSSEPWKTTPLPAPPPKPVEEGSVKVGSVKIWWASFGAGDPVILLHGGAGNSDHWSSQIVALAEKFRVVVIDSRGHGRSTRDTKQAYSYHRMAGDVLAVMDDLKIEQASLVGWSDGGVIALDLAVHKPGRVKKLFIFGTNYNLAGMKSTGPHATFATYFDKCAGDYQRLSATPKDYKPLVAALGKMWKTEPNFTKEQLVAIKIPTVVADGEYDEIIRQEQVKEMAKLIPGAQLLLIPETSHFALWQKPEAFNQALLDFLGGK
jgi:pimeloyl-ACP methyl ester carboxylesterase